MASSGAWLGVQSLPLSGYKTPFVLGIWQDIVAVAQIRNRKKPGVDRVIEAIKTTQASAS